MCKRTRAEKFTWLSLKQNMLDCERYVERRLCIESDLADSAETSEQQLKSAGPEVRCL